MKDKRTFLDKNSSTSKQNKRNLAKQNKNLFKLFGVTGLAGFMAVTGVLAFVPAVMGGNILFSSAQTTEQPTGLGLDPENDPVVFTTTSGLEIKKHEGVVDNKGQITNSINYTSNMGESCTQNLTGFYYFTMGTYSGSFFKGTDTSTKITVSNQPVNWIIIGRGNIGEITDNSLMEDKSPAGSAIAQDTHAELRKFFGNAPESVTFNAEIPDGCILVLSEKILGDSVFNATNYTSANSASGNATGSTCLAADWLYGRYRYCSSSATSTSTAGRLYTAINNLLSINHTDKTIISGKNALNFTASQAKLIRPQQLYTAWYDGSKFVAETPSTDGGTYYTMFPLASRNNDNSSIKQNFCLNDYLTEQSQCVASMIGTTQAQYWWNRTSNSGWEGKQSWSIRPDGALVVSRTGYFLGVRPAFVMEFTPNLI